MATDDAKDPAEAGKRDAAFYLSEIDFAGKHEADWRDQAWHLERRYRSDGRHGTGGGTSGTSSVASDVGSRVNIFYSNVQLLKPATFTKSPPPDVRRRYTIGGARGDEDPADDPARQIAEALEGALAFALDDGRLDDHMEDVRDDALIVGRGIAWVSYEVETEDVELERALVEGPNGEPVEVFVGPDGEEPPEGEIEFRDDGTAFMSVKIDEGLRVDHVNWRDYRESANARKWPDVWWIARRHLLSRRQATDEFGPRTANKLSYSEDAAEDTERHEGSRDRTARSALRLAEVWELWDRDALDRVWLARNLEILRNDGDPLSVTGFYPMPRPLQPVTTTDTRIPVPEFILYQDQANELNELASRRRLLVRALKAVGLVDGAFSNIPDIRDAPDTTLIPIPRPAASGTTLRDAIQWWPVEVVAGVIIQLGQRMDELKEEIFEITGLSDLQRGATKASETATAQRLKGTFGQFRLQGRAQGMSNLIRDLMRIEAEIMAEMFDAATIQQWSGVEVTEDMKKLMENDKARMVRIDVETAETASADVEGKKREAVEYVGAISQLLGTMLPLVQSSPQAAPFVGAVIAASARPFKFGRQFEEALDALVEGMQLAAKQPPPPPPGPSPDAQLKDQGETERTLIKDRTERDKASLGAGQADQDRDAEVDSDDQDRIIELVQGQQGVGA